jgi:hypothetical protein
MNSKCGTVYAGYQFVFAYTSVQNTLSVDVNDRLMPWYLPKFLRQDLNIGSVSLVTPGSGWKCPGLPIGDVFEFAFSVGGHVKFGAFAIHEYLEMDRIVIGEVQQLLMNRVLNVVNAPYVLRARVVRMEPNDVKFLCEVTRKRS